MEFPPPISEMSASDVVDRKSTRLLFGSASLGISKQRRVDKTCSRAVEDAHKCHIDGVPAANIRDERVGRGRSEEHTSALRLCLAGYLQTTSSRQDLFPCC